MRLVLPTNHGGVVKHRLDPARIIETAENLAQRVGQTLPGSGLSSLAVELAGIARATEQRARQARRPILALRLASATAIGLGLLGLWYLVDHIQARWEFGTITELFEATDAGFNLLVILAGALWFLITLEARLKRKRALGSIEELREFIHVIDLTQLYYTPELYKPDDANSHNAWAFDYTYLLFCTQMIGVISNLAALFTRGAAGDSVLRAASDVEMLTNAVTTKLLSKVEIVRRSSVSK